MKPAGFPWFRVAILAVEVLLIGVAVFVPVVFTGDVLSGMLRILELIATIH